MRRARFLPTFPFNHDAIPRLLRSLVWAIVPLVMRGSTTVFTRMLLPGLAEAFSEGREVSEQ